MRAGAAQEGPVEDADQVVRVAAAIAGRADGDGAGDGGLVAVVDHRAAEIASDSTSLIECGGCDAGPNNGEA